MYVYVCVYEIYFSVCARSRVCLSLETTSLQTTALSLCVRVCLFVCLWTERGMEVVSFRYDLFILAESDLIEFVISSVSHVCSLERLSAIISSTLIDRLSTTAAPQTLTQGC